MSLGQVDARQQLHASVAPKTVGANKGYHRKDFVNRCHQRPIAPRVPCKATVTLPGLDARTTTRRGYQTSQRIRKR